MLARFLPAGVGTLLAFSVYGLEKYMIGSLHPTWTQKIGFMPLVKGNTLVLLSKRYRHDLPSAGNRTYVQPNRQIRIDKFDYANLTGLQQTYELGVNDGKVFAASSLK
jgi:hypothetical protein